MTMATGIRELWNFREFYMLFPHAFPATAVDKRWIAQKSELYTPACIPMNATSFHDYILRPFFFSVFHPCEFQCHHKFKRTRPFENILKIIIVATWHIPYSNLRISHVNPDGILSFPFYFIFLLRFETTKLVFRFRSPVRVQLVAVNVVIPNINCWCISVMEFGQQPLAW